MYLEVDEDLDELEMQIYTSITSMVWDLKSMNKKTCDAIAKERLSDCV
jgi:hypothetical protein